MLVSISSRARGQHVPAVFAPHLSINYRPTSTPTASEDAVLTMLTKMSNRLGAIETRLNSESQAHFRVSPGSRSTQAPAPRDGTAGSAVEANDDSKQVAVGQCVL